MATIAQTNTQTGAPVTLTRTTMTATDTLTYIPGAKQTLILTNDTAGALTVNFTGSIKPTVPVTGYGSVATTAGKDVAVGIGATVAVNLDDISYFLQGTVAITGGTGIKATLHV